MLPPELPSYGRDAAADPTSKQRSALARVTGVALLVSVVGLLAAAFWVDSSSGPTPVVAGPSTSSAPSSGHNDSPAPAAGSRSGAAPKLGAYLQNLPYFESARFFGAPASVSELAALPMVVRGEVGSVSVAAEAYPIPEGLTGDMTVLYVDVELVDVRSVVGATVEDSMTWRVAASVVPGIYALGEIAGLGMGMPANTEGVDVLVGGNLKISTETGRPFIDAEVGLLEDSSGGLGRFAPGGVDGSVIGARTSVDDLADLVAANS